MELGAWTMAEFLLFIEQQQLREKNERRSQSFNTALICSTLCNINRDPKRRPKPFKPEDFMPKEKKEQSVNDMYNALKVITLAAGGTVL